MNSRLFSNYPSPLVRRGTWMLFGILWIVFSLHTWRESARRETEPMPAFQTIKVPVPSIIEDLRVDINRPRETELANLNLPQFLSRRWMHYLEKGGRFRHLSDVRRLYGMTDPIYDRIAPFLYLTPKSKDYRPIFPASPQRRLCDPIDINESDSLDWESLRGIGPYLARKIINFRESLGGFTSIDQVRETYGLRDSVFQQLQPCLTLSKIPKPRLSLNQSSREALGRHPYIRFRLAKAIVLYRDQHGPFADLETLLKIQGVTDSLFLKIRLYVQLEEIGGEVREP